MKFAKNGQIRHKPDCPFLLCDLRHTAVIVALQNGVDIKTVSGMPGHFDAGFTLCTYTHVTTKMQEQAADTMGQFIAGNM